MIFVLGLTVFAQDDSRMDIGFGAEYNMNSRRNFAVGALLSFNYNIDSSFSAGFNITNSYNFNHFFVIELHGTFRWYILTNDHTGWFAQTDIGAFFIIEDPDAAPKFKAGVRGGYRIALQNNYFIEPYGRLGYPFAFGIGILAGVRF